MYKADIKEPKSRYQPPFRRPVRGRATSAGIREKHEAGLGASFDDMRIYYHSDAPVQMKKDGHTQGDKSVFGSVIQRMEMSQREPLVPIRPRAGRPGEGAGNPDGGEDYAELRDWRLNDNALVVRGGLSEAVTLMANQAQDQNLYISANSANDVPLGGLATSPAPFPNGSLTVSTVSSIRHISMNVIPEPTENNNYHAAIVPPRQMTPLTRSEAETLHGAFNTIPNQWRQRQ